MGEKGIFAGVYELVASGGQRNRKILNVNANNRSEIAEQEKYQLKIVAKNPKIHLTLNIGEADSREWRHILNL